MKNIFLTLGLCLTLTACGSGIDPKKMDLHSEIETPLPATYQPPVLAVKLPGDYQTYVESYGEMNTFTFNDRPYVVLRNGTNPYLSLLKMTPSGVDTAFGANGLLALNGPGGAPGAIGFPANSLFSIMSCNDKVYAFTQHSTVDAGLPRVYEITLNSTGLTKNLIDSSVLTNNLTGGYQSIDHAQCAGDYLIFSMLKHTAPKYAAIAALRTSDNNISLYLGAGSSVYPDLFYSSGNQYFSIGNNAGNYNQLSINDSNHTITLGANSPLTNIRTRFGGGLKIKKGGDVMSLIGLSSSNTKLTMYSGTIEAIHAALSTDTVPANIKEISLPVSGGYAVRSTDKTFCLTKTKRFLGLAYQGYITSPSNYESYLAALDTLSANLSFVESVNAGTPMKLNFGVYIGSTGYWGRNYSTVICADDSIYHLYQAADLKLTMDRYTP